MSAPARSSRTAATTAKTHAPAMTKRPTKKSLSLSLSLACRGAACLESLWEKKILYSLLQSHIKTDRVRSFQGAEIGRKI
jgi:hypothetical protein